MPFLFIFYSPNIKTHKGLTMATIQEQIAAAAAATQNTAAATGTAQAAGADTVRVQRRDATAITGSAKSGQEV